MKNLKPEEMCLLSIDVFGDLSVLAMCSFWTCVSPCWDHQQSHNQAELWRAGWVQHLVRRVSQCPAAGGRRDLDMNTPGYMSLLTGFIAS